MARLKLISQHAFWIAGIIYLFVLLLAADIPVFWDMYGQVKTAAFFLQSDFADMLPDGGAYSDNGHMPLYPLYLALLFKIFGYKLWVAHLSVLPFLIGILWNLQKLCLRYFDAPRAALVIGLTFFHPAFISQSVHFSQELALVFCSLWLINALLDRHASHIILSSMLLCLLNLRGISFCLILPAYFFIARKNRYSWYVLAGLASWLAWVIYHYMATGWFFAGEQISEFRQVADGPRMTKNVLLCGWKLLDLGSVFGWALVAVAVLKTRRLHEPVQLLLLSSLSVMVLCIPLTNPVSNRYFLLAYVLLLPAFVAAVEHVRPAIKRLIIIGFAIVLFSNNGVTYPNRYGNAWDCSLKSLSYFALRAQLDELLAHKQISPSDVSAGFQLYFNDKYYLMNGVDREYALLSDTEMPSTPYVAESNISNNFNAAREHYLAELYMPVQEFRSGAVYIRLYKRKFKP